MKRTIGVFAHVDAGKTTFCESLLYTAKKIKTRGSVTGGNTVMDYEELEKKRGITIFSDVASFCYEDHEFYLIDTPGHVDFSSEMERALWVLDGAILVISATDFVQSHTIQIYKLLKEKEIPVFIFVNKMDFPNADLDGCIEDIKKRLDPHIVYIKDFISDQDEAFIEEVCSYDDALLEFYLEGTIRFSDVLNSFKDKVNKGNIIPVHTGSALKNQGVEGVLSTVQQVLKPKEYALSSEDFSARVFKVKYDEQGKRLTFLKVIKGSLKVKDEIAYKDMELKEKVHEIRKYEGQNYVTGDSLNEGDIGAVTGLVSSVAGMGIGAIESIESPVLKPALKASVIYAKDNYEAVYKCLKILEAQDPMLQVNYIPETGEMEVSVMGKIQLEVLEELIKNKYGLDISFGEYRVVYRETIKSPIMGYGHYEPLRHYAEVHIRMEPNKGRGIEFVSECHVDDLPKQHQNMIRHFLLIRDHKGILTGSSLTDVKFVLTKGAVHLKHTEGGDLRESAWRAVRQGLEKAKNILLEPYYKIEIDADKEYMGRIVSDLTKLKCEVFPPEFRGDMVLIKGRGPVKNLIEYPAEFLSATKGSGSINLAFDNYYECHNPEEVIEDIGYEKDRDRENVSSSVFCAKGAGFEVKWHEAEDYMHLL